MKLLQQGMFNLGPYNGYRGHAEYDSEAGLWHGEVAGLRDVVTFQGKTIEELSGAFVKSVDDYHEFCKSRGEQPERPYSGRFVVRIPPEVHAKISTIAEATGVSLNELVATRLEELAKAQYSLSPAKRDKQPVAVGGKLMGFEKGFKSISGQKVGIPSKRLVKKKCYEETAMGLVHKSTKAGKRKVM
jgi:predicted HicB family RNase H-like nuclease